MTYDADDVERLLPCVWHESWWVNPPAKEPKTSLDPNQWRNFDVLEGKRLERAADPNDIKGDIDPRRSNSVWDELIDVKTGWLAAPLGDKERATLYLAYGLFLDQKQIQVNQNASQQAISARIRRGLRKIAAHINGEEIEEEEA